MGDEPPFKRARVQTSGFTQEDILCDDVVQVILRFLCFRDQYRTRRVSRQFHRCVPTAVQNLLDPFHPFSLGAIIDKFPNITELYVSDIVWNRSFEVAHRLTERASTLTRLDFDLSSIIKPDWSFLGQLTHLGHFRYRNTHPGEVTLLPCLPPSVHTLHIQCHTGLNLAQLLVHLTGLKTLHLTLLMIHSGDFKCPRNLETLSIVRQSGSGPMCVMAILAHLMQSNLHQTLKKLTLENFTSECTHTMTVTEGFQHVETLRIVNCFYGETHVPFPKFFPNVKHLLMDSLTVFQVRSFPSVQHLTLDLFRDIPTGHRIWQGMQLVHVTIRFRAWDTTIPSQKPARLVRTVEILMGMQRMTLKEVTFRGPIPMEWMTKNIVLKRLPLLEKVNVTDWTSYDSWIEKEQTSRHPLALHFVK